MLKLDNTSKQMTNNYYRVKLEEWTVDYYHGVWSDYDLASKVERRAERLILLLAVEHNSSQHWLYGA